MQPLKPHSVAYIAAIERLSTASHIRVVLAIIATYHKDMRYDESQSLFDLAMEKIDCLIYFTY